MAAVETTAGATCDTQDADEVLTSLDSTGKVLTITFSAALAVGDVVTIVGGANVATATGSRQIATTSVTVADDTTKPTVTGKLVMGQQLGVITFSEALTGFTAVTADIDCVDGNSNLAPGAMAQISGTNSSADFLRH